MNFLLAILEESSSDKFLSLISRCKIGDVKACLAIT